LPRGSNVGLRRASWKIKGDGPYWLKIWRKKRNGLGDGPGIERHGVIHTSTLSVTPAPNIEYPTTSSSVYKMLRTQPHLSESVPEGP
jgi:hypothetical protein